MAVVNHIKKNGRSLVNSRMVLHVLVAVAVVCGSLVASVQAGFGTTATPVTTRKKDSFTRLWFSSYLDSLSAASAAAAAAANNNYNNNNNGYNNMGQQQQQQPQQPQQPQQQTVESTQQYLQQLQTQAQRPQYNTPAPSNTAAAVATPPPTNNPALGAAATYQQYAATAPAYNANNSWNPAVASTAVVPPPAAPAAATTTTATAPPQAFSPPQTAQVPTKPSAVAKPATPPKKPAVEIDEQAVKASRLQKDSIEIKSAARDTGSVEDSLKSNQLGTALEFLAVASLYVGIPFVLDSNWPQIEQQFNNLVTTSNQVEGEAEQLLGNAMKRDLKALFTPMAQAPPKPSTMIQQGAAQSATGWGAFLERNTLKTAPQMDVDAVRGRLLMTDYYKNKQAAPLEASSSTAATTAAASAVAVETPVTPTVPDASTPPVVPPEPAAAAAAAAAASLVDDAATAGAVDATASILEEASVTAPSTPLAAPEATVESVSAAQVTESVPSNPVESTAPVQAATQMTEPVVASGEENGLAAGTTGTTTTAATPTQAEPVSFTPTTTVATADDYYHYNYYNPVDPTTAVIASHLDVGPTVLQEESFAENFLAQEGQFMPMSPTEYLVDDTGTATYDAGVTAGQSPVTSGTITLGNYDASLF